MLNSKEKYKKEIMKVLDEYVYNLGCSSEKGAEYIIETIQNKIKERSKKWYFI